MTAPPDRTIVRNSTRAAAAGDGELAERVAHPLAGLLVRAAAVLAVVAIGTAIAGVAANRLRPHLYSGTVLQAPTPAPGLDGLRSASGEPVDLAAFEGDAVLVSFGYTNCPDQCPVTLSTAALARAGLDEASRERVKLLMIAVDPARDDAAALQTYVELFDSTFVGIGGDHVDLQRVATSYGVYAEEVAVADGSDYTVDHTTSLIGIDPGGRLRIVWPPGIDDEQLRRDLEDLLRS